MVKLNSIVILTKPTYRPRLAGSEIPQNLNVELLIMVLASFDNIWFRAAMLVEAVQFQCWACSL